MTSADAAIAANGKVVTFHYTLRNEGGDVLDTSQGGEPLPYLHGAANIVPGLERQMAGLAVGDHLDAVVPPEEGYGLPQGPGPQGIAREAFPADAQVGVGMQFAAQNDDGQVFPLWVTEVRDDVVFVDVNHPLAGVTLHFEVDLVAIRDATEEEVAHGHPHGPDGHADH